MRAWRCLVRSRRTPSIAGRNRGFGVPSRLLPGAIFGVREHAGRCFSLSLVVPLFVDGADLIAHDNTDIATTLGCFPRRCRAWGCGGVHEAWDTIVRYGDVGLVVVGVVIGVENHVPTAEEFEVPLRNTRVAVVDEALDVAGVVREGRVAQDLFERRALRGVVREHRLDELADAARHALPPVPAAADALLRGAQHAAVVLGRAVDALVAQHHVRHHAQREDVAREDRAPVRIEPAVAARDGAHVLRREVRRRTERGVAPLAVAAGGVEALREPEVDDADVVVVAGKDDVVQLHVAVDEPLARHVAQRRRDALDHAEREGDDTRDAAFAGLPRPRVVRAHLDGRGAGRAPLARVAHHDNVARRLEDAVQGGDAPVVELRLDRDLVLDRFERAVVLVSELAPGEVLRDELNGDEAVTRAVQRVVHGAAAARSEVPDGRARWVHAAHPRPETAAEGTVSRRNDARVHEGDARPQWELVPAPVDVDRGHRQAVPNRRVGLQQP
mmetsp:Transcript_11146/g.34655  ORF Transcript_11146/g.34655 Transcript_11146/m.34655 type:complete len:499 (-) Transcript_11146:506-2002(-)